MQIKINEKMIKNNIEYLHKFGKIGIAIKAIDIDIMPYIYKNMLQNDRFLINNINQIKSLQYDIVNGKIFCINPCLSKEEIDKMYHLYNVDTFAADTIERIKYILSYYRDAKVLVRINSNVFCDTISPYGIYEEDLRYVRENMDQNRIIYEIYIPRVFYSNKGDVGILIDSISLKLDQYKILNSHVNIGGLITKLTNSSKWEKLDGIMLESGEGLIDNVIDGIAQICIKKENSVYLSFGIYSGGLDKILYDRDFFIHSELFHKKKKEKDVEINIYGNSGDHKDFFGTYYIDRNKWDQLHEGSSIKIWNIGAYCNVFNIPNYNCD